MQSARLQAKFEQASRNVMRARTRRRVLYWIRQAKRIAKSKIIPQIRDEIDHYKRILSTV